MGQWMSEIVCYNIEDAELSIFLPVKLAVKSTKESQNAKCDHENQ